MRRCGLAVLLVVVLVGMALLSGCGGGSDSALSWARYSPPADVIAPAQLQALAARNVVGLPAAAAGAATGDLQIFAFGQIPALANLMAELLKQALEQFGGLGGLVPLQAQPHRANRALMALMKRAVTAPPLHPQQVPLADAFFDWTDPETGVHWTGHILEQGGRLLPELRGVGPETNCTVHLTVLLELGSRMQVSGSITGPVVADVIRVAPDQADWQVLPGRALVDASLDLTANAIAGADPSFSADTHLSGEFQVPEGTGWTTVSQADSRLHADGTLGDTATLNVNGFIRQGITLGEGLYWWRHDFQASLAMEDPGSVIPLQAEGGDAGGVPPLSAAQGDTLTFSDAITFSDGMTGELQVTMNDAGPSLSGVLRGPDGTVLGTIDGGLTPDDPPVIHWADGSETVLI